MTLQSAAAEAQSPAKRRATAAVRPKGHWTASHWKSLSVLYLGYSTNIFGLTAFDVTNGLRLADASLGLDNAALGKVLSTGAIVYLIGKLINGIVTDALGGRLTSCCSLFASAVGLLSLSFAKTPTMVTIAWSLCRFAQAAAWPGIMASTKQWFAGNGLGTAIGVVSTSSRSGAILGNLLLAPLLRIYSWRTVVRLASGAALFTGTCLRLGLQDAGAPSSPVSSAPSSPKKMVPSHSCAQLSTAAGAVLPVSVLETVKVTLRSPRLLACFCSNALATSVYQFASLLPLMLTQAGSFSSAAAAQAAALYPLGAFGSIFVATSLWDTVLSRPWLRMLYLSGGTAASCVAMAVLPTAAARSPRTAMALLMVVMFGVSPVYYISEKLPRPVACIQRWCAHSCCFAHTDTFTLQLLHSDTRARQHRRWSSLLHAVRMVRCAWLPGHDSVFPHVPGATGSRWLARSLPKVAVVPRRNVRLCHCIWLA